MKKLLTTSLLLLVAMTSRAQIAGNGPIQPMTINYSNQVGVGNWLTVQAALTDQCAKNGGYGQVFIQQGAMPSDGPTIGGVTSYTINGCTNVTILDQRGTAGASCYSYSNSTTYVQGSCVGSGSLPPTGVTTAQGTAPLTVNGDNAAHAGVVTIACPTCLTGSTPANHGVMFGTGGQALGNSTAGAVNTVMIGQGSSANPIFSGTPAINCTNCTNIPGTTAALTMNDSGSGAASGTTFNGGTARTLSTNTIGAANLTQPNIFVGNTQTISMDGTAGANQLTIEGQTNTTQQLLLAEDNSVGHGAGYIQSVDQSFGQTPLRLNPVGGAVLIGTATNDGTHLLQVNGNAEFAGQIAMNSNKITGCANGTASTDVACFGQLSSSSGGAVVINIQNAPYYGSGSAQSTTTTGTNAPGTSITVASAIDFTSASAGLQYSHQGISIAGAGVSASTTATTVSTNPAITVASATGLIEGMAVSGTNIPVSTYILSISGTSVTLSNAATGSGSGITMTFTSTYVGTVTSVSGTTLTVTPATSTSISSGAVVLHDDTAAIQAAVNTASQTQSVTINLPDTSVSGATSATYWLNGPFQNVATANALIVLPAVQYYSIPTLPAASLTIQGTSNVSPTGLSGAILRTNQNGAGDVIDSYALNSGSPGWGNQSNILLYLKHFILRTYDNPDIGGVNVKGQITGIYTENFFLDNSIEITCPYGAPTLCPGASGTYPATHTQAIAIGTAELDNLGMEILKNTYATGWYTGFQVGEHASLQDTWASFDTNCYVFAQSTGHAINGMFLHGEHCQSILSGTADDLNIQTIGIEQNTTGTTYLLNDPSNNLHGIVNYECYTCILAGQPLTINGGANMVVTQISAAVSTIPQLQLANNWKATQTITIPQDTVGLNVVDPTLGPTHYVAIGFGGAASANNEGNLVFVPNATAALSVSCLSVYGQAGACINGNNDLAWTGGIAQTGSHTNSFAGATAFTAATTMGNTVAVPLTLTSPSTSGGTGIALTNTSTGAGTQSIFESGSATTLPVKWMGFFDNSTSSYQLALGGGANPVLATSQTGTYAFSSSTSSAGNLATVDTGISRDSAGVLDCGNGTQGSKTCTFNAAAINVGGVAVTPAISNAITTATGGSGTGTVTCLSAACTNLRGTYSVAGGTFTTGNFLTLVWPTTTTAYVCTATMNGGTGFLGVGNDVATATGMNISAGVTILGVTVTVNYSCRP